MIKSRKSLEAVYDIGFNRVDLCKYSKVTVVLDVSKIYGFLNNKKVILK